MRNYRASIVAGALVACVLALAFALAGMTRGAGSGGSYVALVHDGDGAVHEYSLDEDGEHEVATSYGRNVVRIEDGTVRMTDADCPNRSCMSQAPLGEPGAQIVCLPHRLWIEVVDASAGGGETSELDEDLVVWQDDDAASATGDAAGELDTIAR